MIHMNISLPEDLKQYVDSQVAEGRCASVSEYFQELILADQERAAEEELEALLLEGLEGPETVMVSSDWQDIRKQALALLNAPKKKS
jgi:antitoxin ParD1/3/4